MWMVLLVIVLATLQSRVGKKVFQESCNKGRCEVRGELTVPSIYLVFLFMKHVSDNMGFDSSLLLFLMCVWETGNSSTFSFKNVGT